MMDSARQVQIDALLRKAEQYRRLARGPVPWDVAENLERWAGECEREAADLADCQPPKAA